jgi:hypothetical protein
VYRQIPLNSLSGLVRSVRYSTTALHAREMLTESFDLSRISTSMCVPLTSKLPQNFKCWTSVLRIRAKNGANLWPDGESS